MWCMTLKCRTAVPGDRPRALREIFVPAPDCCRRQPPGQTVRPIRTRIPSRTALLAARRDLFLLPYCFQYRSISADIRKLTSRLISRCRFSSRTDIFFAFDLPGQFIRAVNLRLLFLPPSLQRTSKTPSDFCEWTLCFSFQSMVSIVCCSMKRSNAFTSNRNARPTLTQGTSRNLAFL